MRRTLHLLLLATSSAATALLAAACSESDGGTAAAGAATGGVKFAVQCEVPPDCGGDPTGTWSIQGGCVEPPKGGFECATGVTSGRGTVTGTYTFGAGDFSADVDSELRQCGWIDSSGSGNSGSLEVTGNQLTVGASPMTFCVEGDTLWLLDPAAEYPHLRVLQLKRDVDAGG